jgi:transcription elongation GreA/GreB family factor
MKESLARINPTQTNTVVSLGSIVYTTQAAYFLGISAGKLTASGKEFFAVSVSSPIGKILLGKKEKDEVVFNGKQIVIEKVV